MALDGRLGEYIVIARRKGTTWYVAAMTDWTARDLIIPLSKLDEIRYQIDKLELIVDDSLWPLPKYRELLFIR